jgi:putative ATPase
VISPLLSRCQVYILKPFNEKELLLFLNKGKEYFEQKSSIKIDLKEKDALLRISGGDARKLYNALELALQSLKPKNKKITITNEQVLEIVQQNLAIYDKAGEQHYDIISAFIKSIRGSDPNAAIYYLARMVEGGEDPKFIARRMLILASEDIGNANPNALLLANACFDAINKIGWPEGRIILSQTAIYLASSPKSNASYIAINDAQKTVKETGDLSVPLHIRNAPTKLMKDSGYGKGYKYAHEYDGNFADLEFLPEKISGTPFYNPGNNSRENDLRKYLRSLWKGKYGY